MSSVWSIIPAFWPLQPITSAGDGSQARALKGEEDEESTGCLESARMGPDGGPPPYCSALAAATTLNRVCVSEVV